MMLHLSEVQFGRLTAAVDILRGLSDPVAVAAVQLLDTLKIREDVAPQPELPFEAVAAVETPPEAEPAAVGEPVKQSPPEPPAKRWSDEELAEQFAIGECATAEEAFDMLVALGFTAGEIAFLSGADGRSVGRYAKGSSRMPQTLRNYLTALLPKLED